MLTDYEVEFYFAHGRAPPEVNNDLTENGYLVTVRHSIFGHVILVTLKAPGAIAAMTSAVTGLYLHAVACGWDPPFGPAQVLVRSAML